MIVRHKEEISSIFDCPGGGAQGTNLGILSFLVYVNSCGVPLEKMLQCLDHEHKEMYIGLPVEENKDPPPENLGWKTICHPTLPEPDPHVTAREARFKYIDDNVSYIYMSLNWKLSPMI